MSASSVGRIYVRVTVSVLSNGDASVSCVVTCGDRRSKRLARTHYRYDLAKRKRAEIVALRQANRDDASGGALPPVPSRSGICRGRERRERVALLSASSPRLIVDCAYETLMTDAEVFSLCKQIRYAYAVNARARRTPFPLRIALTSLSGAMPDTMATVPAAAASAKAPCAGRLHSALRRNAGFDCWVLERAAEHFTSTMDGERTVYLTAESPNVLSSLDISYSYVVGGLVDHNRLKGISHDVASAFALQTARLPLREAMQNGGRRRTVITVNQVMDVVISVWQQQRQYQQQHVADEPIHIVTDGTAVPPHCLRWWQTAFAKALPARAGWKVLQQTPSQDDDAERVD